MSNVVNTVMRKQCIQCLEVKYREDFPLQGKSSGARRKICKDCHNMNEKFKRLLTGKYKGADAPRLIEDYEDQYRIMYEMGSEVWFPQHVRKHLGIK